MQLERTVTHWQYSKEDQHLPRMSSSSTGNLQSAPRGGLLGGGEEGDGDVEGVEVDQRAVEVLIDDA